MTLSTEVFVMVIFIAGIPFFYFMLRDSGLPGHKSFMLAYVFLMLSNIFTVVEEFWLNTLFNTCEHLFITLGSIMMLVAIIQLMDMTKQRDAYKAVHNGKDVTL